MYDICCVGHITLDKVVTPTSTVYMAGGTSFYFSNAISNMDVRYTLVTSLAQKEIHFADHLRSKGVEVNILPSAHTVYFENIYPENLDERTQRVSQKADAFTADRLLHTHARIFHLGPLLADDIPVDLIRDLSKRAIVSLDVQGYLREVRDQEVCAIDWPEKREALQHLHILKASRSEMQVLTGSEDVRKGAMMLYEWGVKEVIITLGSMGSVICKDGIFYTIPAFKPATAVVDATGCGDTYMAGYLYQYIKGAETQHAGEFAAAMATLKIESSGPFNGTKTDVLQLLDSNKQKNYVDEF